MNLLTNATCINTNVGCFCESFTNKIIQQPLNSLTSLSFVVLALYIIFEVIKYKHNILFSIFYILSLLTLGLGSFYYHSRFNLLGQTIDVLGMFMIIITGPILINNNSKISFRSLVEYFIVLLLILILTLLIPEVRRYVFAIGIVSIVVKETINIKRNKKMLFYGLGIFLVSFVLWVLDSYKILCSTTVVLNFHAWWHILNALACYFLYRYYLLNN